MAYDSTLGSFAVTYNDQALTPHSVPSEEVGGFYEAQAGGAVNIDFFGTALVGAYK